MRAVLEDHDVLLVSPTGSGKSLTYQVLGLLLDGPTVVVSPLLALGQDQIRSLADLEGDTSAVRVSSAETDHQQEEALRLIASGDAEFLFVSPEQLANDEVLERVAAARPSLVAVDEAHCVSAWGHDFRPDYFRLEEFIHALGRPRVVALTATASPPVRSDIVNRLGMHEPTTIVTGFARPNLTNTVLRSTTAREQEDGVLQAVASTCGPGIVYCRTRRSAEEYAERITNAGVRAGHYHAGMPKRARDLAYRQFMGGDLDVMVATSAFGMGIDKPDVRFVFHAQVPESPDTYYQELGRAGRDGEPASVVLFYRPEDLSLGRFFSPAVPARDDVEQLASRVLGQDEVDRQELRQVAGLGPRKLGRLLNLLQEVRQTATEPIDSVAAWTDAALEQAEAHRRLETSRVEMMRGYAETSRCRWDYLLGYFGEPSPGLCGQCDNCRSGAAQEEEPVAQEAPFPLQSYVEHEEFGPGTVMDLEEGRLTVLFEQVGYRTLDQAIVLDQDLLRRA